MAGYRVTFEPEPSKRFTFMIYSDIPEGCIGAS
jgi:hypothetical protein